MKKLLFICAIALLSCKKNTDTQLPLIGNWVLQTSMVEYYDADNKKLCENSPSQLQYLKNIDVKDGMITLKPNEVKNTKATTKKVLDITVLPVVLVSFKGTSVDNGVSLEWVTASESNTSYFEVLRKNGDSEFIKIAALQTKSSSNNSGSNYIFLDNSPSLGNNYYRLSTTDLDGTKVSYPMVTKVNKNTLPFVPIKEGDNYSLDLPASNLAGFSKIKITQPNANTMEWRSSENNVAYTGCGVIDGVAHHAVLKMVYVRQ